MISPVPFERHAPFRPICGHGASRHNGRRGAKEQPEPLQRPAVDSSHGMHTDQNVVRSLYYRTSDLGQLENLRKQLQGQQLQERVFAIIHSSLIVLKSATMFVKRGSSPTSFLSHPFVA
jgi:hypothetical protein